MLRIGAQEARFRLAGCRATVAAHLVTVVTFLVRILVAIATSVGASAGYAVGIAASGLFGTSFRATFAIAIKKAIGLSRVAVFTGLEYTVAADALRAYRWAGGCAT